ncbi:FKBP-type peptidyl-prolyl cis-trans isomerase [Demequina sp. NBRC 110057]|uniref:FKBP-type peptidyl-prolyl cis-trans isomerase n=1 Tax=Demequina sp. NBRC 110057 TaxID=1570346 RepID=UPI0009FD8008|nr:FKBP-type peptidyl-prolyl cis-trans isomerase [Demequina sp. NBRC 110057]
MLSSRWTTVVAIGAVSLLGLTACSSDSDGDSSTSTSPSASASADTGADTAAAEATLGEITWNGDDEAPVLEFESPLTVDTTAALVVNEGDGEDIVDGQVIELAYTVWSGEDQTMTYSTYDSGSTESVSYAESGIDPVLYEALQGQKVGTDFIYGSPGTAAADGTVGASTFMAVTVQSATTPLDAPEGEAVEPEEGLPTVTLDDTGAPSIDFSTATEEPSELVAQPLIKGEGDTVEEGDTVTVNYTGWVWDGEQFDSSWDRGASASFVLSSSSLIQGWVDGLAGQTVGSQVMLIIPSDLGYGDEDTADGSIPGGSTLVFVVDILAAS